MDGHSGLMVGCWMPESLAARLALPEGEAPSALHMTLCYCGDSAALGEVNIARALVACEALAQETPPLTGRVSGLGRFAASPGSDNQDVIYASVDMPGMAAFRERLAQALGMAGCPPRAEHGFTPHVTLAYLDPEAPMPDVPMPTEDLRLETLSFIAGERRIDLPLRGRPGEMPGMMGEGEQPWLMRFLAKLKDLLKGRIRDGDLSAADWEHAVAQARGHVGGLAKAEAAKAKDGEPATTGEPGQKTKRAGEASRMGRLAFLAPITLAEGGQSGTVQVFPRAGSYDNPRYGEIRIDRAFLAEVKRNFDARVYQQELPLTIDLEHMTQLSGAAGWISALEIRGDQGMWAEVQFNERGRELVAQDAFRYFSPTYYDEWQDPATGHVYNNLLIGGALTNYPFFKGMEPVLMAAAEGVYCFVDPVKEGAANMDAMSQMMAMMAQMAKMMPPEMKDKAEAMMQKAKALMKGDKENSDAHSPGDADRRAAVAAAVREFRDTRAAGQHDPATIRAKLLSLGASEEEASAALTSLGLDDSRGGTSMGMTDDEARQFAELRDGFRGLTEKVTAAETRAATAEGELRAANDRLAAMTRQDTRRELGEFVRANRLAFQGEVDTCVDRLEKLAGQVDADTFGELLDEKRTLHDRLKESELFGQRGSGLPAATGVASQFDGAIKAAMGTGLDRTAATAKVASENPELYRRYNAEHNAAARRGGE